MTADEKNILSGFLHLTASYLKDGHARTSAPAMPDEVPIGDPPSSAVETQAPSEGFSSLPLAYQVDENEEAESFTEDTIEYSPIPVTDDSLKAISAEISVCESCGLAATRKSVVPGEGAERPLVMVIGEGPGADEDKAGRPFVGKAGQLLDKMLDSIGLSRNKNCFIGNMVKCRPPGNRDPSPGEIAACYPYLERQITLLSPQIILCAGRVAAQNLLKTSTGINALRGEFMEFRIGETSIPVLCTFHPSAVLRNEYLKRPAWEDLKLLKSRIDDAGYGES